MGPMWFSVALGDPRPHAMKCGYMYTASVCYLASGLFYLAVWT